MSIAEKMAKVLMVAAFIYITIVTSRATPKSFHISHTAPVGFVFYNKYFDQGVIQPNPKDSSYTYFGINDSGLLSVTKVLRHLAGECISFVIKEPRASTNISIHVHDNRVRRQANNRVVNINETSYTTKKLFSLYETSQSDSSYKLLGDSDKFEVRPNGNVFLKRGQALDYEKDEKEFVLNAEVTKNGFTSKVTVTIKLLDVNDEIPHFVNKPAIMKATVPERPTSDYVVYEVLAKDADAMSKLEYSITRGNEEDMFKINPSTGVISVNGLKSFSTPLEYHLRLLVKDITSGNPSQAAENSLQIVVGTSPPQFLEPEYTVDMQESIDVSFTVAKVMAISFQKKAITYEFVESNSRIYELFSIVTVPKPMEGRITVTRDIDFEDQKLPTKVFILQVLAIEGSMSSQVKVTIRLIDKNDNPPLFTLSTYSADKVAEDYAVGRSLVTVTATDADSGINGQLSFFVNDDHFQIKSTTENQFKHQTTAVIAINRTLDYEDKHTYIFQVYARDKTSDPKTGTATVQIQVLNVNDEKPVFTGKLNATIPEGTTRRLLGVAATTDLDGDNVRVYFEDPVGTTTTSYGNFKIAPASAHISVEKGLTTDQMEYILPLIAIDDGRCCKGDKKNKVRANYTVTIQDTNTHAPEFKDCSTYKPEVREESQIGTKIIQVKATDKDSNTKITYMIDHPSDNNIEKRVAFSKIVNGQLEVNSRIDRENGPLNEFSVTIIAQDNGPVPRRGFCLLTVTVKDINDHSPNFGENQKSVLIARSLQTKFQAARVQATDPDHDQNSNITYSIIDNPGNHFSISPDGRINLKKTLPSDPTKKSVIITVQASDHGKPQKSSKITVVFNIVDIDDRPPQWNRIDPTFDVNEGYVGTVAQVSATSGKNSDDQIRFFIVDPPSEGKNETLVKKYKQFSIHKHNSTTVRIVLEKEIDYESDPKPKLVLRAYNQAMTKDGLGQNSENTISFNVIDQNDNGPTCPGDRNVGHVLENTIDSEVLHVSCGDADKSLKYRKLNFRIEAKKMRYLGGLATEYFTIRPKDGSYTEAIISNIKKFDREDSRIYDSKTKEVKRLFIEMVVDDGVPSSLPFRNKKPNKQSWTISIVVDDVNDNPPKFTQRVWRVTIPENHIPQSTIVTVLADDQDVSSIVQYYIIGDKTNDFQVDSDTGVVSPKRYLDYENPNGRNYNLKLLVMDAKYNDTASLIITVTDVNDEVPKFGQSKYVVNNITEAQPLPGEGKLKILTVTATDGDEDRPTDNRRFRLVDNSLKYAEINGITGEIYLLEALDREYREEYSFNIAVVDEPDSKDAKVGYASVSIRPIDINDNAPNFPFMPEGQVDEHSVAGTPVLVKGTRQQLQISAEDPDAGKNSELKFSFAKADPYFKILDTGEVFVSTPNRHHLDREGMDFPAVYTIIVVATDNGDPKLSNTATLSIRLTDINDHKPKFVESLYQVSISEALEPGASVIDVMATDKDVIINKELDFSLPIQRDITFFSIKSHSNKGRISVYKSLDYEKPDQKFFNITVRVSDGLHSAEAFVAVTVLDANDNEPVFSPKSAQKTVFEDISDQTVIARFSATDQDSNENGDFTFSIDRNTDQDYLFDINDDGQVTLAKDQHLDFETKKVHLLNILAIDKGSPPKTGSALLEVKVRDINDNHPILAQDYNVQFPENVAPVLIRPKMSEKPIRATDIDGQGNQGPFLFSLLCDTNEDKICDKFSMNFTQEPTDFGGYARLHSKQLFDREVKKYYDIPIEMSDSGTVRGKQTGTVLLRVTIGDQNDNPHKNGTKEITLYTYEDFSRENNISLGRVYVEDLDDWDLPDKKFEVIGHPPSPIRVNRDTGIITMKPFLPVGSHSFKVRVEDRKWPSAVGTVNINVIEIPKDAVYSSGSLRLTGITADKLIEGKEQSKVLKFRTLLAKKLNVPKKNVHVFSIMPREKDTDIRFAAHGSPWKGPAFLDGTVMQHRHEFEKIGITIGMTPINECRKEKIGCETGCTNEYNVDETPMMVNSNDTSFIGVSTSVKAVCVCRSTKYSHECGEHSHYCYNQGTCYINDWNEKKCKCPIGFHGPRCQKNKISFDGNGWAAFPTLSQCFDGTTSFEFITNQPDGLLLYNGPYTVQKGPNDYIEVSLLDGEPVVNIDHGTGELKLSVGTKLNDGVWHRLDVVRKGKHVRLIVDQCKSANITEDENISTEDRSLCEASGVTWGRNTALNVFTHLQLGGTMVDVPFPASRRAPKFKGCIKNLHHNNEMYDLTPIHHENTKSGCPQEDSVCVSNNEPKCGRHGDCIGSLGDTYKCVCHPGYMGAACNQETPVVDFKRRSYIQWRLVTNQLNQLTNQIQLRLRTRQPKGLLFAARSKAKGNEYIILELVDKKLQMKCSLGRRLPQILSLPSVDVSNGQWHTIYYDRVGKYMSLSMDSRVGPFYNETHGPDNGHRHFDIDKDFLVSGANFDGSNIINPETSDLVMSCMTDVRYDGNWLPMDVSEQSSAAVVQSIENIHKGCKRDDCLVDKCIDELKVCVPLWEDHVCRCIHTHKLYGDGCTLCCENNGTCQKNGPCICPQHYSGDMCEIHTEELKDNELKLSSTALALILVAVLLIIVGLLAMVLYTYFGHTHRKQTILDYMEPYNDIKENAFSYDEEGAGEEDQTAYDINLLSVPIERDTMRKAPPHNEYHSQAPLTAANIPDMGNFIGERLDNADMDTSAPPHDSVREFLYEGGGSSVGSLSSLNTSTTNEDQDYDYLNEWGPKFAKLADLYGAGSKYDD